jgi:predicted XRE-type DNA-binding protein
MARTSIRNSSGNVFADLGIEDFEGSLAKSELSARILRIIQRRHLTQAAAGKLLGISQPNVSALLNGRLDGFSTERLFRCLNRLGCDVQIKVSKSRCRAGHVRVSAEVKR